MPPTHRPLPYLQVPALIVSVLAEGRAADDLDEWLNVLQSIQLPFALVPLLHFTSSRRYMGKFKNQNWVTACCWLISAALIALNLFLVSQSLAPLMKTGRCAAPLFFCMLRTLAYLCTRL